MADNNSDSLTERLSISQASSLPQTKIILLPLDIYVERFQARYTGDHMFRDTVHKYVGLDTIARLSLGFNRIFWPGRYRRTTAEFVKEYAIFIHGETKKAYDAHQQMIIAVEEKRQLSIKQQELSNTVKALDEKAEAAQQAEKEQLEAVINVEVRSQREISHIKANEQANEEKLRDMTNLDKLLRDRLVEKLSASGLVKVQSDKGIIEFNEQKVAEKFEDRFLEEILGELERDGEKNVYLKILSAYADLVSHQDMIEHLGEIMSVDWTASLILSRQMGYRMPVFPYLITDKYSATPKGKRTYASVDTAFALDCSGSMTDNKKFEMATKTILAVHGLMRKLNPMNSTYLSCFQDDALISSVTTAELLKGTIRARGGTPAHLGIRWLLNTLKDSPHALAYLATDGEPDSLSACINEAERFRKYQNIRLRIFYIDPNPVTEDNIRKIGLAAGLDTKVCVLKNYQLPGGVIKDVGDALGDMVSVGQVGIK